MYSVPMPAWPRYCRIASAMNSGPLSLRMWPGSPVLAKHLRQDVDHVDGRHRPIHLQGQALPRVLIDQAEPLERPARFDRCRG